MFAVAGYHFPVPVGGKFSTDTIELSSQASKEVLRLFWRVFLEKWNHVSSSIPYIVVHRHGQKEPLDSSTAGARTYAEEVDSVFDFEHVSWMSAAIGCSVRPTTSNTLLAKKNLDCGRLLLCTAATDFMVCGRLDVRNFQSMGYQRIRLSEFGEEVVNELHHSLHTDRAGLLRSTLYSEAIHLSRARSMSFHDFDFHR